LTPSGITRRDYLKLMADDIGYWTAHEDQKGAIIDPYQNGERQYSTPAFALAGALLVSEAGRNDLLEPVTRAMSWSCSSLAAGKAADSHSDFFIPLIIHARRLLKDHVSPPTLAMWDKGLKSIVPEKIYRMNLKGMNWNIVSSSGELLRRQDDLVVPEQRDAQTKYLEERLADHMAKGFTDAGMYEDPGGPLAYDAFSRLWLGDMMACGAYDGPLAARLDEILKKGGLSSILLLSPTGEWPGGGRSSHHNWEEAEIAAICEMNAARWQKAGDARVAGAFKRAAHLAFQSMLRWQRPSGELYIVKNRYDPEKRFAYERYSNHSQYNTLPMAMLALAYVHADESIAERATPAEVGGYVFDLRERFHKVVAAAGGYYVEIDTAGDPHYNATGLQRVHRVGVPFSALSDSTVEHRSYGEADGPGAAMAPGIQWKLKDGKDDEWDSLARANLADSKQPLNSQVGAVKDVELSVQQGTAQQVAFTLRWTLVATEGENRVVTQQYSIDEGGVECAESISGGAAPTLTRLASPVLVFDGMEKSNIEIEGKSAKVTHRGCTLTWQLETEASGLKLDGPQLPCHTGMMQALAADLPGAPSHARWRITLQAPR
jgi:hypothetical protein